MLGIDQGPKVGQVLAALKCKSGASSRHDSIDSIEGAESHEYRGIS